MARESLSFGNPVAGLIIELVIYKYIDPEFASEMVKEVISAARYSDNINPGGFTMEHLDMICQQVVNAFKKYGLFFKAPIEPFSQLKKNDERLKGERVINTLGYKWDLKDDTISTTMEPAIVSKKRGMSRNVPISQMLEDDKVITKRSLAVLTASIVSTDGVLSAPLQLGAKLLLSRVSTLCPGSEGAQWNVPLVTIDKEFVEDVKAYVKSIERYDDIKPIRRKLVNPDESLVGVVVFHDASVSTVSAIVYLLVEDKVGWKELRIAKAGTKNHNGSIPVLEHVSRTYSLVMIKPLLAVIHQCGGPDVKWYFFGDSTCSLKLLKEEVNTTNKLSANTKIQLEQMSLLSEMFQEAEVKAVWLPSRLNVSDVLTRASKDPVEVANSVYYREAVLPSGERLVDLIGRLEDSNTYVRASKGKLFFTPKDDKDLNDLGHFDK